jgi:hypothetical protein
MNYAITGIASAIAFIGTIARVTPRTIVPVTIVIAIVAIVVCIPIITICLAGLNEDSTLVINDCSAISSLNVNFCFSYAREQ